MKNELTMLDFKKCYAHRTPSGFIMRTLPFGSGHPLVRSFLPCLSCVQTNIEPGFSAY